MKAFQKLLDKCFVLDQEWRDPAAEEGYKLGSYNPIQSHIALYNVLNTPANLIRLRKELDETGVTYRLLVLDSADQRTNIHLLDIGL